MIQKDITATGGMRRNGWYGVFLDRLFKRRGGGGGFIGGGSGGGGGVSYDADAQNFIDRVGGLSTTEQDAINTLVGALKGYSIWSKIYAYWPCVGADKTKCSHNLISTNYQLIFGSGTVANATGIRITTTNSAESAALIDTQLDPFNISTTDFGMSLYYHQAPHTGWQDLMGFTGGDNHACRLYCNTGAGFNRGYYGAFSANICDTPTDIVAGFITYCRRPSGTIQELYQDGASIDTAATPSAITNHTTIGLLASRQHDSGSVVGVGSNDLINKDGSSFICHQGLSGAEVANLYTAVQAFETELSRSV